MLLIIGIAMILYGYITFKYSHKKGTGKDRNNQSAQLPEWFPLMYKFGGLLLIIIGLLLSLTYFIL